MEPVPAGSEERREFVSLHEDELHKDGFDVCLS
jgi:hypothetical protein